MWETVDLPHDWAINGPFYTDSSPPIGGGMGRLPVQGVAWYRRKISVTSEDKDKSIFLDIDGAMSYAMVWLNEKLVGGWPYGYNSFRVDLTPYLAVGDDNQIAIRLDNPVNSTRWYPGGGIYRNVWLTRVDKTHVALWGTHITSRDVSAKSAVIEMVVQVENKGTESRQLRCVSDLHVMDKATGRPGDIVAQLPSTTFSVVAGQTQSINNSVTIDNPQLWGPWTSQHPNMYIAVTRLYDGSNVVDTYETNFGVRSVVFDVNNGLLVNGERVRVQGVNQHHDLGALGAAFNTRAAERHLEILRDMGCNAIRMSHNPPAPELLGLTDRMGFLVIDEIFDVWEREKNANDFHLIFQDWHEADLRTFIRRDRNHPSVIAWSVGNEVGEQYTDAAGASIAQSLRDIAHEEDSTRPVTASMNYAKPNMPFPAALDIISLNYQGEGIRDSPAYAGLQGTTTPPLYPDFHKSFPNKMIWSSETSASLSTRGTYLFPVTNETSAPQKDTAGGGGDPISLEVSAFELYTAPFGASPDKVFAMQDRNPFVAGEFVWAGWDYLGEPTPYYTARSSYYGIIDLAGFKKDRYYLYQSRWRPSLRVAHILPHWTWPDRVGKVTPVHVFTAAEEGELFLNGQSQGRQRQNSSSFRLRWDEVVYEPGEIRVVTYKNGTAWANDTVQTTGNATQLRLTADRSTIAGDGLDLSFLTLEVIDAKQQVVPIADNLVTFSVSGVGDIVATDNGDPADMVSFSSKQRRAFYGLALAIVRARPSASNKDSITITATAEGLLAAQVTLALQ
jgi:beta-galactosidase